MLIFKSSLWWILYCHWRKAQCLRTVTSTNIETKTFAELLHSTSYIYTVVCSAAVITEAPCHHWISMVGMYKFYNCPNVPSWSYSIFINSIFRQIIWSATLKRIIFFDYWGLYFQSNVIIVLHIYLLNFYQSGKKNIFSLHSHTLCKAHLKIIRKMCFIYKHMLSITLRKCYHTMEEGEPLNLKLFWHPWKF